MVYQWLKNAHDILMPPICVLCRAAGSSHLALCPGCREELPWIEHACATCALPLPADAFSDRCARCLHRPPPVARTYATLRYQTPVDFLITGLKFRSRLDYARVLGELLAQRLQHTPAARADCLMPVPLHSRRLRERGFNQAIELARPAARRWGIPIDYRRCRRRVATQRQADLDVKARRSNVRGAFTVDPSIRGRRVTIIDDVITTGQTVFELAHCLNRAGAREIHICCAARAPREH